MNLELKLFGYEYSVYSWIARLALCEKCLVAEWVEIDPFAEDLSPDFLKLQPFGLVPVLEHGDFALYETRAITAYVDEAFEGRTLQPESAEARARMRQVISVVDGQAYWPLVRQVFAQDVFRPAMGEASDKTEIAAGLERAPVVLAALEDLVFGAPYLVGDQVSLADIHLFPMLAYFALSPQGAEMLRLYPKLSDWFDGMAARKAVAKTTPEFRAG